MLFIYLAALETPEDKEKMSDLYYTYREYLVNVAQSILHSRSDAEDLVHQAFLRVADDFTKIGEVSSHQTQNYLVIIVRGLSRNLHKKRSKVIELPFEALEGVEDALAAEDQELGQIENEVLLHAIEELPVNHRDVLYLMYFEELSVKEIAKRLNLSESAVKKRLERARQALRKVLTERDW